jgi:hypothetical protein
MKRVSIFILLPGVALVLFTCTAFAGSVDVSGYTDKDIYVEGELDINSGGSVDGYLTTDRGREIYVEGELESGGSVEIDSDS